VFVFSVGVITRALVGSESKQLSMGDFGDGIEEKVKDVAFVMENSVFGMEEEIRIQTKKETLDREISNLD
jgi:hypothetical protein